MKGNSAERQCPDTLKTLREQGQRTHLLAHHLELQNFREDRLVSIPSLLSLLRTGIWYGDEVYIHGVLRANHLLGDLFQGDKEILFSLYHPSLVLWDMPDHCKKPGSQSCLALFPLLSSLSPLQNPWEMPQGLRMAWEKSALKLSTPPQLLPGSILAPPRGLNLYLQKSSKATHSRTGPPMEVDITSVDSKYRLS